MRQDDPVHQNLKNKEPSYDLILRKQQHLYGLKETIL